jgi:transposase
LAVHRVRQELIKALTAQSNQIRGLLSEFGIVLPVGISSVFQRVPILIEQTKCELPGLFQELIWRLLEHLKDLDRQVDELERQITDWHRSNELSLNIGRVPGIGPITASALVASIGDAKSFANGRQLAAWLGLVPKQHSTGGKANMLGISKRGDTYLRTLLINGGRAIIRCVGQRPPQENPWLARLLARRHKNVATVAPANKNARIVWALLTHDREFRAHYSEA